MNSQIKFLIVVILLCFYSFRTFSQKLSLKATSIEKKEEGLLRKINYKKTHQDTLTLIKEINKISTQLSNEGYFLNSVSKISKNNNSYIVYFTLNEKTDSISIITTQIDKTLKEKLSIKKDSIFLPINELNDFLKQLNKLKNDKGFVFSESKLTNFKFFKKTLFANLKINSDTQRNINKVVFKGYKNFPKNFKRYYFRFGDKKIFSENNLTEISKLTKQLDFVTEIKPPESLFTKDSTYLYIYVEKMKNNSFDGIVNFASKDDGKVLFNGTIDLTLKNTFNTGEEVSLFWNSIGKEQQEFTVKSYFPYIFNTKISSKVSFSIYKQDSTFVNNQFTTSLHHQLKPNSNLYVSFSSENSNSINSNINNIVTYRNQQFGIGYEIRIKKNGYFNADRFYLNISPKLGKRFTSDKTIQQIQINTEASYIIDINKKNSIFLKNTVGYLNSEEYLANEIFRIGGANSLRGFNEQSIFAKSYVIQNIEYRFATSNKSYFYSVTDLGVISTLQEKETLLGLGIGYLFNTKNSIINLSTVLGNNLNESFQLNPPQLIIRWINIF